MKDRAADAGGARTEGEERDERRTDTRERVLEVAARHFAEHGYAGASLRAVQREAGVNPATVHYHFGSKEALYHAVIDQFLDRIQAERLARLGKARAGGTGRERLEALLSAYLAPHLEVATTSAGYNYARILAFVQANVRDAATDIFDAAVTLVRNKFADALAPLFPEASRRRILQVLAMAVNDMAMTPIRLGERSLDAKRMAQAIADCVAYTAAGFERLCGPLRDPG